MLAQPAEDFFQAAALRVEPALLRSAEGNV